MARKDYIPTKDGEFLSWEQNFINYAQANLAALGLVAADLNAVTAAQAPYETAYLALLPAQAAAKAAKEARDDTRRDFVAAIRTLVRRIQASPLVSDQERQNLGITVPKPPAPAPVPDTRPLVEIEQIQGLTHVVQLIDSGSGKRGKPDDVAGAEVFMKIATAPPLNQGEMSLVNFTLKTRFEQEFIGADVGKTAYYSLRWFNPRGEKGPFGPITAATIAA